MTDEIRLEGMADEIRYLAAAPVARASTTEEIAGTAALVAAVAEDWLGTDGGRAERARIACGPGCGTCCLLNVSVLFPEAVAIAGYVRNRFTAEERAALAQRLLDLSRGLSRPGGNESILLHLPCALLDATGSCSVYPVRPLLCRGVTSLDPQSCREAIAAHASGATRPILMDLFQKAVMARAYCTFAELIRDAGRDDGGLNLTAILQRLLERPGMPEEWIAGAPVEMALT